MKRKKVRTPFKTVQRLGCTKGSKPNNFIAYLLAISKCIFCPPYVFAFKAYFFITFIVELNNAPLDY